MQFFSMFEWGDFSFSFGSVTASCIFMYFSTKETVLTQKCYLYDYPVLVSEPPSNHASIRWIYTNSSRHRTKQDFLWNANKPFVLVPIESWYFKDCSMPYIDVNPPWGGYTLLNQTVCKLLADGLFNKFVRVCRQTAVCLSWTKAISSNYLYALTNDLRTGCWPSGSITCTHLYKVLINVIG